MPSLLVKKKSSASSVRTSENGLAPLRWLGMAEIQFKRQHSEANSSYLWLFYSEWLLHVRGIWPCLKSWEMSLVPSPLDKSILTQLPVTVPWKMFTPQFSSPNTYPGHRGSSECKEGAAMHSSSSSSPPQPQQGGVLQTKLSFPGWPLKACNDG